MEVDGREGSGLAKGKLMAGREVDIDGRREKGRLIGEGRLMDRREFDDQREVHGRKGSGGTLVAGREVDGG